MIARSLVHMNIAYHEGLLGVKRHARFDCVLLSSSIACLITDASYSYHTICA